MTTFSNSPRLLKGAILLIDPASARVRRMIVLQYNPERGTCPGGRPHQATKTRVVATRSATFRRSVTPATP